MTSTPWVPMVSRAATTPLATGTSTINRGARAAAGARAASRASRHAGFTLLEILVVVLIIGILTAGMLLSLNFAGKDSQLETESKRLLSLMNYARDQAELQTRDFGIYFGQHGYEFVVYDVRTGAWRTVDEDDALRERTMPSGLDFKLVVDARPIVLDENMKEPPPTPAAQSDSDVDVRFHIDSTQGRSAIRARCRIRARVGLQLGFQLRIPARIRHRLRFEFERERLRPPGDDLLERRSVVLQHHAGARELPAAASRWMRTRTATSSRSRWSGGDNQ